MSRLPLLSRVGVISASHVRSAPATEPSRLPEADWLLTCVASDGALRETPGDVNVRPYMSHYGALGLVRAYEVSNNGGGGYTPYLDAAWGWFRWYAAHMDPSTGYVNDYTASAAFADDFNRGDGAVGNGWVAYPNAGQPAPTIVAGKLASGGSNSWELRRTLAGTPDRVQITLTNPPVDGGNFHLFCGSAGASILDWTGISVSQGASGDWRIWTWSAGNASQQALTTGTRSGGAVTLTRTGTTYTATLDGVTQVSWSGTASWGTTAAVFVADAAATLDDFTADTVAPWVDSGAADSTDAYAGMYLAALWTAVALDNDGITKLAGIADSVGLAVTAITSTQQADGLTWALPTYTVKYLEDNIESLVGLRAAALLAQVLDDAALGARVTAAADAMARGVGYLWNEGSRTWDFAVHENGVFQHNDWADENSQRQQIWAAGWGARTAGTLGAYDSLGLTLTAYEQALPGWASQTSSYEVMPAWVYWRLSLDPATRVDQLQSSIDASDHAYPWTVANSGQFILAKYDLDMEMLPGGGGLGPVVPADLDPLVTFPAGANLLPNPTFVLDSNSDGEADGLSNYGAPSMKLLPLTGGNGNLQRMTVPYDNNWAINWDPVPVTPGHYYTFSIFRRISALETGGQAVIKYELVDGSGNVPAGDYGYETKSTVDADVARWSLTAFIPPGIVSLRCIIEIDHGGTVDLAYPKLEDAGSPTDWASAPGFPAVFTDDFNRADGALTGPYRTAVASLSGGTVKVSTAGEVHLYSSTKISSMAGDFTLPDTSPVALRLCAADLNNCYQANFDNSGACGIYTVIGGTVTQIAETITQIAHSTPHLEFARAGSLLTLRANGTIVTQVSYTNATLDSNLEAELVLVSPAAAFDNLTAVGMTPYGPTLTWGAVSFTDTTITAGFTLSGMGSSRAEVVVDSRPNGTDPTPVFTQSTAGLGDGPHSYTLSGPDGYPYMQAIYVDIAGGAVLGQWSRAGGQIVP